MQQIQELHQKISHSLASGLKKSKITEEDTLAYMIFFESLWEDEELIRNSIIKIAHADWIFEDIVLDFDFHNKMNSDSKKAKDLLNTIKQK